MKIEFEQPLDFALEVIETDEQVPSMRVSLQVVVTQFQNTCKYEGTFWIECTAWDGFTKSLRGALDEAVELRDMGGCFFLAIKKSDEYLFFVWEYTKMDVGGGRQMKIEFKSVIDHEVLSRIRNEFLEFPVWW